MLHNNYILTFSCADQPGIVAAVAAMIAAKNGNITESGQYWDRMSNRFFMRVAFALPSSSGSEGIQQDLQPIIGRFGMEYSLADASRRQKVVVMVSKFDHALQHLMYQIKVGWLNADVVAIVSNHEDSRHAAELAGVPFYNWPIRESNKAEQEARLVDLVAQTSADLVVLARYMQILSDNLSNTLRGRIINIHHSFLPSFKGAKPYHQAFDRGVKLIGATAHYVTADLDEGPIIEQETERVTHALSAEDLVATGRDIESRVLARAVKLHLESRVIMNGHKTVVFN